ncbi:hypothetical protein ZIOFF_056219 [Zingiber officinale]|uniref:Transposase n=1 Tax=Zingiber officinale TaxID=94328 RepID=A0A8J5FG31_ZINOF|nr:hypothetical protein ZIOFF_056219 [Zingiber officinale]
MDERVSPVNTSWKRQTSDVSTPPDSAEATELELWHPPTEVSSGRSYGMFDEKWPQGTEIRREYLGGSRKYDEQTTLVGAAAVDWRQWEAKVRQVFVQFLGEMESSSGSSIFSFLGSCKYKEDLYMISIFNGFSLMELFLNLRIKCEEIAPQNVILQYLAPHQNMYVTLNEDDGVRIMTHLYTFMRLTIINMRAVKKDEMDSHNLERLQLLMISCLVIYHFLSYVSWRYVMGVLLVNLDHVFETEEETQTSNDDHLEVGLVRNSIDVWSHCISGEGQIFKNATEFRKCAKNRGHPKVDAAWVSNIVMDRLRGEPSYRPCMMLKDIHRYYGVELNYNKVWKGKELVMHDIHGVEEGVYDKMTPWDNQGYSVSIPRRREATMGIVKRLSPSKENALAKTYAKSRSLKLRKAYGWSFEVVDGDT